MFLEKLLKFYPGLPSLYLTWEPLVLLNIGGSVEELNGVEEALPGGVVDLVEVGVVVL